MIVKSLDELNRDFIVEPVSIKKKRGIFFLTIDTLFLLTLIIGLTVTVFSGKDDTRNSFLGYSIFTVTTGSMQEEISKNSLILVHVTDADDLKVGDTITFAREQGGYVTHKITRIYEDYQDSGARAFQTKGTHNGNADKEIIYGRNIVGKVILTIPAIGAVMSQLGANTGVVIILFGLCLVLYIAIRLMTKSHAGTTPPHNPPKGNYPLPSLRGAQRQSNPDVNKYLIPHPPSTKS